MCFGGSDTSKQLERANVARQEAITRGTGAINQSFAGFDPGFYRGIYNARLGSLLPQLQRQYEVNRNSLVSSLSQRGLLNSSAARQSGTALEESRQVGQGLVANQALQASQDLQRQVEQEKNNLLNQLVSTQDPNLAGQRAVASAASLQAPSLLAPLGDLFQGFANTYLARQLSPYFTQTPEAPRRFSASSDIGRNYYTP